MSRSYVDDKYVGSLERQVKDRQDEIERLTQERDDLNTDFVASVKNFQGLLEEKKKQQAEIKRLRSLLSQATPFVRWAAENFEVRNTPERLLSEIVVALKQEDK